MNEAVGPLPAKMLALMHTMGMSKYIADCEMDEPGERIRRLLECFEAMVEQGFKLTPPNPKLFSWMLGGPLSSQVVSYSD